jgi:soluble lytic murein transglycosylase-like protein
VRFRALLSAGVAAVLAAGLLAELTILQRPAPAPERPLLERPRFTERHLAAVLARRAPRLREPMRDRLSQAIWAESTRAGYDPLFVLSMVAVESGFRVSAESERGARGLLQLKPSTFAWISAREPDLGGEDLLTGEDPIVDVRLAVRYFRWLEQRFRSRDAALFAYNAGPGRAQRLLRSGEVPEKLREYARLVRKEHERLSLLADLTVPLPEAPRPPQSARRPTLLAQVMRFDMSELREGLE